MTKTSYEKEGLNSLNELFEKLIVCSEKQDKASTMRIVSSLNDEEKDYLYTWASEQGKLDKVAGIVIKAEMDKKAFDINCRFKKQVLEALPIHGYCLENDPTNPDCLGNDTIKFTDNKYINGEIRLRDRKVYLEARDAENKKYEKTIDYSEVEDLMDSINHFQNDIKETFEKKEEVVEEVKEEPFDILNDPEFMKQIGADWVSNLIKKKAEEITNVLFLQEEGPDGVVAVFPDIIETSEGDVRCYSHTGQHSHCSKEYYQDLQEATAEQYDSLYKELTNAVGYTLNVLNQEQPQGNKSASIKGNVEKKAEGEGLTFDQLSDSAKEKVKVWLNEFSDDWWYSEILPMEEKNILDSKYAQYGVSRECLDIEWDNRYCSVNLASGFKYWPSFKDILVNCAKQVLKDLPKFKDNPDLLNDWATEAASDMYFVRDHFEFYAGLSDIDDNSGYVLSEKISDLCTDAYEDIISPILSDISDDFFKVVSDHTDDIWSDDYVRETCEANDYRFDEQGNLI